MAPPGTRPVGEDLTAKGVNGQLAVVGNKVRISRKGFFAVMGGHGTKGDKEILISTISAIQLKKAGLTNGYIQFTFVGGTEATRGGLQATKDENTVIFTSHHQAAFEAIKERIDSIRDAPVRAPSSDLDDLERLAELRDRGIITEGDFEAKKRQLLGL